MPDDAHHRVLLNAIVDLARVEREVATRLSRDLSCPRASLGLMRLLDRAGELGVGDIAQALRVDISVASRQVSALVDAGLVERIAPDTPGADRRVRTVRLSPAGRSFVAETYRLIDEHAAAAFASWTEEEILAAATQVTKIADAVAGALSSRPDTLTAAVMSDAPT